MLNGYEACFGNVGLRRWKRGEVVLVNEEDATEDMLMLNTVAGYLHKDDRIFFVRERLMDTANNSDLINYFNRRLLRSYGFSGIVDLYLTTILTHEAIHGSCTEVSLDGEVRDFYREREFEVLGYANVEDLEYDLLQEEACKVKATGLRLRFSGKEHALENNFELDETLANVLATRIVGLQIHNRSGVGYGVCMAFSGAVNLGSHDISPESFGEALSYFNRGPHPATFLRDYFSGNLPNRVFEKIAVSKPKEAAELVFTYLGGGGSLPEFLSTLYGK